MGDNKDEVKQHILSTVAQLLLVEEAQASWKPGSKAETQAMESFKR